MLKQCIDGLEINPDGIYVDVTFGGGGHSRAIFEQLSPKGKLISFDQDQDAKANTWQADNFHFVPANFAFISNHLRLLGIKQVDGILGDLGVSSHQFDKEERGFSIRGNAELDMRMNQNAEVSAKSLINEADESTLLHLFRNYGELKNARKVVNTIIKEREGKTIHTTQELMDMLQHCAQRGKENKFFAQVFQALRIEVNEELSTLESFLEQCTDIMKPGGKLVIMSYHSLEDRLVKNYMKKGNCKGELHKDFYGNILKPFDEITRKPITATEEEIELNNRARSAKLRIAKRNGQ